jgi:hypothetical protein
MVHRNKKKYARTIACLNLLRIVNEQAAAVPCYGFEKKSEKKYWFFILVVERLT